MGKFKSTGEMARMPFWKGKVLEPCEEERHPGHTATSASVQGDQRRDGEEPESRGQQAPRGGYRDPDRGAQE